MRKKLIHWIIWIAILSGLLLGVGIFSLSLGSSGVYFKSRSAFEHTILFDIRLPRIILGFAIGGALSIAGVLLQGIFRNPLVEPYTLGISGGAALGVCLNIVLRLNQRFGVLSMPVSGILGAGLIILLVYFLSIRKGILRIHGLLLVGVMVSFVCSSLIMLIMAITRTEDLQGIVFWIMGSLEEPNWMLIKISLLISAAGLIISYFYSIDLNALMLGEEEAVHLGVNIEKTKKALFIIASLLTGCSVSIAGIIGFVGLVVPHLVRIFIGRDHRISLIASYLTGGAFLMLCDTLARTIIAPLELPVGVITGILGGGLFLYALAKREVVI